MMTSTTGIPPKSRRQPRPFAFTLIELVIVMAVLAVLLALTAPSLSNSMRGHNLDQAGAQLLALTEYGREEAVSQGVPMVVWLNPAAGQYGVNAKTGYPGDASRDKHYSLTADVHFDAVNTTAQTGEAQNVIEFSPDGILEISSIAAMRLVDRSKAVISVAKTSDGFGYELRQPTR